MSIPKDTGQGRFPFYMRCKLAADLLLLWIVDRCPCIGTQAALQQDMLTEALSVA